MALSREARSSEKFMHGIKLPMAKKYLGNLSEEARKGIQDKAGGVRGKPRPSQEQAKVPVSAVRCTVSFHPACPVLV